MIRWDDYVVKFRSFNCEYFLFALAQCSLRFLFQILTPQTTTSTVKPPLNNCKELIRGRLQAKWEIQGEYLIVELFGRIREDEYMAFGLSGHSGRSQMVMFASESPCRIFLSMVCFSQWKVGSDVVVAYYDRISKVFRADDYFISHLAQCDGTKGVCPDERLGGQNDVTVCE